MKKVVLFFAVATAVALASCGNKQPNTPVEPTPEEGIEAVITDTISSDSIPAIIIEEEVAK